MQLGQNFIKLKERVERVAGYSGEDLMTFSKPPLREELIKPPVMIFPMSAQLNS